jgi:hypothetical protein
MAVSGQLHTSVTLPPENETLVSRGLEVGFASSAGLDVQDEKILLPLPGIEPQFLICPARGLVTVHMGLYCSGSTQKHMGPIK